VPPVVPPDLCMIELEQVSAVRRMSILPPASTQQHSRSHILLCPYRLIAHPVLHALLEPIPGVMAFPARCSVAVIGHSTQGAVVSRLAVVHRSIAIVEGAATDGVREAWRGEAVVRLAASGSRRNVVAVSAVAVATFSLAYRCSTLAHVLAADTVEPGADGKAVSVGAAAVPSLPAIHADRVRLPIGSTALAAVAVGIDHARITSPAAIAVKAIVARVRRVAPCFLRDTSLSAVERVRGAALDAEVHAAEVERHVVWVGRIARLRRVAVSWRTDIRRRTRRRSRQGHREEQHSARNEYAWQHGGRLSR